MEGVILSLYLDRDMQDVNDRENFKYLSWSPYDRIRIKKIHKFNEFFQNQFQTKWVGVSQQMHLVQEYPEKFRWKFDKEDAEEKVLIQAENKYKTFGLCAVVMVRMAKDNPSTKKSREKLYAQLHKTENCVSGIEWNAFYSLGAEDIVFIVLANSIRKIHEFINRLNMLEMENSQQECFSRISSFVNMNTIDWQGKSDADLLVRLNLKSGRKENVEVVKRELINNGVQIENIQHLLLGKCVLDVKIPAQRVDLNWFSQSDKGIFNGESEFYKQYIASSRSYWSFDEKDGFNEKNFLMTMAKENINSPEDNIQREENDSVEELMRLCYKIPMAQFVIKEYQRLINSNQSGWWTDILKKQFKSIKIFLREYVENENKVVLNCLLSQIQNVLLHIRQSTISTTEVPYLNYIYAGSYNDIMKMYYGIISELFEIGYGMKHEEDICQYEITFCVDFESTAYVHSDMYTLPKSSERKRFVVFHLPFDAFTDIEETVKYLSHEVFHYIAPYSRKERNRLLLGIWCRNLIQRLITLLIKEYDFSDEMKYLLGQQYGVGNDEHMIKLVDKIHLKTKEIIDDFDSWIINNFWGESVKSFQRVYNIVIHEIVDDLIRNNLKVVELVYRQIVKNETVSKKVKMNEVVVKTLNKMFKVNSEYYNASSEMKRLAHAYREAFSDLNAVYLFGLDVTEYLQLSYKLEVERRLSPSTEGIFRKFQTEPSYLGSFETRLGMVLDQMFGFPVDKKKVDRYFLERTRYSHGNMFCDFLSYVEKIYNKFIHEDKMNRHYYQNLFIEINTFWGNSISEKILKKRREFRKILGCGETLEKSISVVDIFSNKSISFMKNSTSNIGEKIRYTFIADERDVSYGEVQVENLGQFFEYAYRVSEEMIKYSGEDGQPCWYRGICNRNYSLLPSLYRLYDNKGKEQVRHSIYAYQTKILQDAYYLTMKMSGLWTEQLHGIAEHTCCLQHYGMPTTLLDFSLDMLVALYFALNPDREEDRTNIDIGKSTPKVVIFNPVLYYKALWSLKAGKVIEDEPYARCSPVMFDSGDSEMKEYFVYDMSAEKSLESEKRFFEKLYVPNPRINLYPKPVIIQQTNSRVLSQNGIFMAYNLNTVPDSWGKPFRYLDLKIIQNEYMELFKNEKKKKEAFFLKEIIIDSFAADMIRKQLDMLGLNKSKMYPELSEIFKAYSK